MQPRRGLDFAGKGLTIADVERHIAAGRRVASINVWRSIDTAQPIRRDPLALCEAASVCADDKVPFAITCPDVALVEAHVLARACETHRWLHWPAMEADECLLFVSGDTAGAWPSVPHTSFSFTEPRAADDDAGSTPPPPRRSIEARVFVLFGVEGEAG